MKLSSYQRLKQENQRLKDHVSNLYGEVSKLEHYLADYDEISKGDNAQELFQIVLALKMRNHFIEQTDKMIMNGEGISPKLVGLLDSIKPDNI